MFDGRLMFDGSTFDPDRDGERLKVQLNRVRSIMSDGRWYTLQTISMAAAAPMQSVSARIRDLRKPKHGSYVIERRYVVKGVWEYRMVKEDQMGYIPASGTDGEEWQ